MYQDLHRFFLGRFDANVILQAPFSTEIDDFPSRLSFRNIFLSYHALAKLHVYTRDLLEYIPSNSGAERWCF
jgi:hypothetical protein